MAIDTPALPIIDLRAMAAREWAYQLAVIAERERAAVAAAREQLIAEARSFAMNAVNATEAGPQALARWRAVRDATIIVHGDPLNDVNACTAEMVLFGEPFVFRYDDPQGPTEGAWGLRHQNTCLACGHWSESWPISDLADLGRWLERARGYCCLADRNGAY